MTEFIFILQEAHPLNAAVFLFPENSYNKKVSNVSLSVDAPFHLGCTVNTAIEPETKAAIVPQTVG
jgi:hypothetical protein